MSLPSCDFFAARQEDHGITPSTPCAFTQLQTGSPGLLSGTLVHRALWPVSQVIPQRWPLGSSRRYPKQRFGSTFALPELEAEPGAWDCAAGALFWLYEAEHRARNASRSKWVFMVGSFNTDSLLT